VRGFTTRQNELGFTAVALHYKADPSKDYDHPDPETRKAAEEWFAEARRSFPDPNKWAQEMELNWWVSDGTRVYPQFMQTDHCGEIKYKTRRKIYRAWDFGWITPACLIAQIDAKDRLNVLYEVVGKNQVTKDFAGDVIEFCSKIFPNHYGGFQDFCDPAGQQAKSTSEKSEVRDVEILQGLGVFPSWDYGWSRKDGRSLVHQLLTLRIDGTPSMLVSATGCPVLLQGFLGKYVFPPKKGGTAHDEPDESNHPWADIHACLRYLATGLYTALGLIRPNYVAPTQGKPENFTGYGTPKRKKLRGNYGD
jgi:hypothetical protein